MHRSPLHRSMVFAWAVWFLAGTTLALCHRHDHVDCPATVQDLKISATTSAEPTTSHSYSCRHAHKHQHPATGSHSHFHSHASEHDSSPTVPANNSLPCRHDDCSLCQFLGLTHSTPPSVTVVSSPACLVPYTEWLVAQCEIPPAITVAAPRAPPQCVDSVC